MSVSTIAAAARLNECFCRNDLGAGFGFLPELAARFGLMQILYSSVEPQHLRTKPYCGTGLLEDPADQPPMSERIHHTALQHPSNRLSPFHLVAVFRYRIPFHRSRLHGLPLHRHRIVHKQLDPHRRETGLRWTLRPILWRLMRQKELRPVYRQSRDNLLVAELPKHLRTECPLVKLN